MTALRSDLFVGVVPFVAVAQARSFRAAAKQLGLTPSALSKAIGRLEQDLGVRLLNRTARSVSLTGEGQAFLVRCQQAVSSMREAREQTAHGQRAPRGELTLSLPLILGRRVLMPALERPLQSYPALSIRVSLTDRFVDLEAENLDVAVRIGQLKDSSLTMRKLGNARWTTVASPSYLARHGTPTRPDQLRQHNCLRFLRADGLCQDWLLSGGAGQATASPLRVRGTLVSDSGEGLIEAAASGLGIFQAHDYAVFDLLRGGQLVEILADHAAPGPPIAIVLAAGRRASPKVRAFIELATNTVQSVLRASS